MISIKCRDFRGLERADISCGPISLVAGNNAAGKSSLAQATGAALCGYALTVGGINRSLAGALIHVGAADALVELRTENGTSKMIWPACTGSSQGDAPPWSSKWAAGIDSPVDLDPKERARIFSEYLKSDPTGEDIVAALNDVGLSHWITSVQNLIDEQGWDVAYETRRKAGADRKSRWAEVAGVKAYGSVIATNWLPQGWHDDLADSDEAILTRVVADAKAAHEKAIATTAISSDRRRLLEEEAAALPVRKQALDKATEIWSEAYNQLNTARAERDALPSTVSETGRPCAHCGGLLVTRRISLREERYEKAGDPISDAELKKRRIAKASADGSVSKLEADLATHARAVETATAAVEAAERASTKLNEPSASPAANAAIDAFVVVERAELHLRAFQQKTKADEHHAFVVANDRLLGILEPRGLRAKKLSRVLDAFNRILDAHCNTAVYVGSQGEEVRWKPVTIAADMVIAYGGRPYGLISASEQARTRVVLQVAMAKLDGSSMVVIDPRESLDALTKSGIFSMLAEAEICALVCLTLSKPSEVPDLAAAGLGCSYWLTSGITEPIVSKGQEAA